MPFRIQRVPRALNNLLGIVGGGTPIELEDRVQAVLDMTQIYGAPQRRILQGSNAAQAEAVAINLSAADLVLLNGAQWYLLFGMMIRVQATATMTALQLALWLGIQPGGYRVANEEFNHFGATVTGAKGLSFYAPYPILLPGTTQPFGTVDILGTDATCDVTLSCDVALLT